MDNLDVLKVQVEQAKAQHREFELALKAAHLQLKEEKEGLEKDEIELQTLNRRLQTSEHKLQGTKSEQVQLEQTLKNFQADISRLSSEINSLQLSLKQASSETDLQRKKYNSLLLDSRKAHDELDEMREAIETEQKRVGELAKCADEETLAFNKWMDEKVKGIAAMAQLISIQSQKLYHLDASRDLRNLQASFDGAIESAKEKI